MVAELVLERVSRHLGKDSLSLRQPMLYREGDMTHFGQVGGRGRVREVVIVQQCRVRSAVCAVLCA